MRNKRLRSGYTTGACAAAASKAAVLHVLGCPFPDRVEIPFPDGSRHGFRLHACTRQGGAVTASVIKDAGDDPDVTNGAEIQATVRILENTGEVRDNILLSGGNGVGTVTKPGLPVKVGEPAINPVPRAMIQAAVNEAVRECGAERGIRFEVVISVRDGQILAESTLNKRLGIVGGLSILGTTGIVRPISSKAWTDTIEVSMKVARAAGLDEVILSTGRTSERTVQEILDLPSEARVMMGDYLKYSLEAAGRHGFARVHLAGMWAKILKAGMEIPQTHVRHGALETRQAAEFLKGLGLDRETAEGLGRSNTAREILERLRAAGRGDIIRAVCVSARDYAERLSGLPVTVYLVTSENGVIEHV